MELRRLRYFIAVAEQLNFRRAAEQLHVAQPALSQQIRKLENELGVVLLFRTKRSVALTPAGSALFDEAVRILHQADAAGRAARNASEGSLGRLRMAYPPGALSFQLADLINRFAVHYPGVEVVPEVIPAGQAVHDVVSGRLDVAVACMPLLTRGLKITSLGHEQAVAAVPDRHRLSGRQELALDTLGETPLILLPRAGNPAFHDGVLAACRATGVAPAVIEASESNVDHALLLVAAGAGVALLPASAARYTAPAVRFLPVTHPQLETELVLLSRGEEEATVAGMLRLAASGGSRRPFATARPALELAS